MYDPHITTKFKFEIVDGANKRFKNDSFTQVADVNNNFASSNEPKIGNCDLEERIRLSYLDIGHKICLYVDEKEALICTLNEEKSKLMVKLNEEKEFNRNLMAKNANIERKLQETLESKESSIQKLLHENKLLEEKYDDLQDIFQETSKNYHGLRRLEYSTRTRSYDLDEKLNSAQKKNSILIKENRELKQKLELFEQGKTNEILSNELKIKLEEAEKKASNFEKECFKLKLEMGEYEKRALAAENNFYTKIKAYEQDNLLHNIARNDAIKEKEQMEETFGLILNKMNNIESAKSEVEMENNELKQEIFKLKKERDEQKQNSQNLLAQLSEATINAHLFNTLKTQKEELDNENKRIKEEIDKQKSEISKLKEEKQKILNNKRQIKTDLLKEKEKINHIIEFLQK